MKRRDHKAHMRDESITGEGVAALMAWERQAKKRDDDWAHVIGCVVQTDAAYWQSRREDA